MEQFGSYILAIETAAKEGVKVRPTAIGIAGPVMEDCVAVGVD